jgi:hypothetical protein
MIIAAAQFGVFGSVDARTSEQNPQMQARVSRGGAHRLALSSKSMPASSVLDTLKLGLATVLR